MPPFVKKWFRQQRNNLKLTYLFWFLDCIPQKMIAHTCDYFFIWLIDYFDFDYSWYDNAKFKYNFSIPKGSTYQFYYLEYKMHPKISVISKRLRGFILDIATRYRRSMVPHQCLHSSYFMILKEIFDLNMKLIIFKSKSYPSKIKLGKILKLGTHLDDI